MGPGADCPMKSTPPFVSSSPAPHLIEEGQPKNTGGEAPAIIFVWPSPTRVGAAEDEVMGVMIYWGNGTAPTSLTLFIVGSHINSVLQCNPMKYITFSKHSHHYPDVYHFPKAL